MLSEVLLPLRKVKQCLVQYRKENSFPKLFSARLFGRSTARCLPEKPTTGIGQTSMPTHYILGDLNIN